MRLVAVRKEAPDLPKVGAFFVAKGLPPACERLGKPALAVNAQQKAWSLIWPLQASTGRAKHFYLDHRRQSEGSYAAKNAIG